MVDLGLGSGDLGVVTSVTWEWWCRIKVTKFIIDLRNGYQNRIQHPKITYGRYIGDSVSFFSSKFHNLWLKYLRSG